MSRTRSMEANCRKSDRSRSVRRRAFSNSARVRSSRSWSSAFSLISWSRSAVRAASWPSTVSAGRLGSEDTSDGFDSGIGSSTTFRLTKASIPHPVNAAGAGASRYVSYRSKRGVLEGAAGLEDGAHDPLVIHAHGPEDGDLGGKAVAHAKGHADEGEILHGRVGLFEPDADFEIGRAHV